MREGWPRYALERYSLLKKWRNLVDIVARACKEVLSDECVGVYVVGGIAEGRPTVLSDIDVVVVVSNAGLKDFRDDYSAEEKIGGVGGTGRCTHRHKDID